jgi:hypothetical protein
MLGSEPPELCHEEIEARLADERERAAGVRLDVAEPRVGRASASRMLGSWSF